MVAATLTHISPTTGKRMPCRATVRACRFEGHEPVKPAMEQFIAEYTVAPKPTSANPHVQSALDSKLAYRGPKPTWWAEFEQTSLAHPQLSHQPELLDVIDSPSGKLAVVWEANSLDARDVNQPLDSGYRISSCSLKSMESGKTLGYVRVAQIDDYAFNKSFGSDEFAPFRLAERYGSERFGLRTYKDDEAAGVPHNHIGVTGEELVALRRRVWLGYHSSSRRGYTAPGGEYVPSYRVNESHVPDDATVAKDLKKAHRELSKRMRATRTEFATPYVDFSRIDEPLKGQGFGSALYVYTAKRLAQQGQVLRGSGTQSGEAKGVWQRFAQQMPTQTGTITLLRSRKRHTMPILDFRAPSAA